MSYQVQYAGVNLHDFFTILNVERTIMPPRENFTKEIPGMNGKYYTGYKYGEKKIELECFVKAYSKEERVDIMNEIAFILDVDSPKRLIIDDSPGKYCYAVPEASSDPKKIMYHTQFKLTFVCYDPITYAIDKDFFPGDEKKIVSINNAGTTDVFPLVSVGFGNTAHFLQCTSYTGETVLIGTPPSVNKPNAQFDPVILKDNCELLTGWNPVGNVVDNANVSGDLSINGGGYGITCNNFGTGDEWHGGGKRKNFTATQDFKVEVKMEHNSKGDLNGVGAGTNPPVTDGGAVVKYQCTAEVSLWVREGRGTQFRQLGYLKNGEVVDITDIQNNWGCIPNYKGQKGYVSMSYMRIYNQSSGGDSGAGNYKINATPSLRIRSGRGTNYKQVGSIKNNAIVYVSDIQDNWGKVSISGVSGYISMQYAIKTNETRAITSFGATDDGSSTPTAEDRLGRLEVYGFDPNGVKLFKMSMQDVSEWYEYSEPEIQIGSSVVLDDNKTVPSPKTIQVKDEKDENKTVTKEVDSGKYGDWNEFVGWFTVQRRTNDKGQQEWYCKIEKLADNGTVERSIQTNTLVNSNYPKGNLSSIVIFIGQYKQVIPVDVMTIDEIYVTDIGAPPAIKENKPLFKQGDELVIDFSEQKAYLNGRPCMNEIDIGSQFFTLPVGNSQIICKSDDTSMDTIVGIQKRWI